MAAPAFPGHPDKILRDPPESDDSYYVASEVAHFDQSVHIHMMFKRFLKHDKLPLLALESLTNDGIKDLQKWHKLTELTLSEASVKPKKCTTLQT